MKKQILTEEFKRMQKLAGIITESQLNETSQNLKVSFGPFKNVEYYEVGNDKLYLIVTNSDNFGEIENSIDLGGRDYMTDKEISFLNKKVEDLADKMSEYLTSIGIENEVYDNPIGYGQEIDNLVVSINSKDLSNLITENESAMSPSSPISIQFKNLPSPPQEVVNKLKYYGMYDLLDSQSWKDLYDKFGDKIFTNSSEVRNEINKESKNTLERRIQQLKQLYDEMSKVAHKSKSKKSRDFQQTYAHIPKELDRLNRYK